MGIDALHPNGAHIALLTQELVVHHMQIHQPPGKGTDNHQKNAQHGAVPPGPKPGSQSLAPCCCFSLVRHCLHLTVCCFRLTRPDERRHQRHQNDILFAWHDHSETLGGQLLYPSVGTQSTLLQQQLTPLTLVVVTLFLQLR